VSVERVPCAPDSGASTPPGTVIYAVGDVHGRADLLAELHAAIDADRRCRAARRAVLIHLGDYLSRGAASPRVVEQVMQPPVNGVELVNLKGNHEDMALRFVAGELGAGAVWLAYGGAATLAAYGVSTEGAADGSEAALEQLRLRLAAAMPAAHVDFFRALPASHREGDYYFAHAGVLPGVALDAQTEYDRIWIRGQFLESTADHGAVVVHGHSIAAEPQVRHNRIGIDTGAYSSDVLTCLVLHDTERLFLQTAP